MNSLRLFANGFLIGIANIIPGMSGGTLALVLGIYERLIGALRRIGLSTVKKLLGSITLRKDALTEARAELRRIDFSFSCVVRKWRDSRFIAHIKTDCLSIERSP